ncbi:aminopeptidase P N-terminal domain-containing protein, partial [Candidatus Saccharibacteria bacterium]|nr:aminopeptidase P N-terminal domain-containing protein [Candidatus Saccharibacteria bacterium]
MSHLTRQFFAGNRAALRAKIEADGPVVVAAHGRLQRSADTTYPFSQNRNFWYLTGIDEPDLVLVITRTTSYIILPPSDAVRDLFDGAVDTAMVKKQSGVDEIFAHREGWEHLKTQVQEARYVHLELTGPPYSAHHSLYVNPAKKRLHEKLQRIAGSAKLRDIRPHLQQMRSIKQSEEVAAIRKATQITTATLDELRGHAQLSSFKTEYELEAAIGAGFRRRGATGHAYTPIVASGAHATTLHYVANTGKLDSHELVVVDVGAEVDNYAADVTRTISKSKPSMRQMQVYDAVHDVQQTAQSLLKPGIFLREYEEAVCLAIGKQLVKLGLSSDASDMATIRRYYPHATSHFLGLDVHDVGDYNQPLAPGMVLTC